MDIRLQLITGVDIPIPECSLVLHQPSFIEISYLGQDAFYSGLYTLVVDKSQFAQDKVDLSDKSNFQVFMAVIDSPEAADKKKEVIQVLQMLLFPGFKVTFTPRSMIFLKEGGNPIMIDDNNFDALQNMLREVFCLHSNSVVTGSYNPGNEEARKIAEKLNRGRQIAAAQKGEEQGSIFVQYISSLAIGIHSMSLQDLIKLTIYQLYDLIERYSLYTSWDIDIRSRMAGAKIEKQPENWMKNIH